MGDDWSETPGEAEPEAPEPEAETDSLANDAEGSRPEPATEADAPTDGAGNAGQERGPEAAAPADRVEGDAPEPDAGAEEDGEAAGEDGAPATRTGSPPPDEPTATEEASPETPDEQTGGENVDELLPPELTGVHLPFVGAVPFWAAAAAMAGVALLLAAVAVLACWRAFYRPGRGEEVRAGPPGAAPQEREADRMDWLDYPGLLERARLRAEAGHWAELPRRRALGMGGGPRLVDGATCSFFESVGTAAARPSLSFGSALGEDFFAGSGSFDFSALGLLATA